MSERYSPEETGAVIEDARRSAAVGISDRELLDLTARSLRIIMAAMDDEVQFRAGFVQRSVKAEEQLATSQSRVGELQEMLDDAHERYAASQARADLLEQRVAELTAALSIAERETRRRATTGGAPVIVCRICDQLAYGDDRIDHAPDCPFAASSGSQGVEGRE